VTGRGDSRENIRHSRITNRAHRPNGEAKTRERSAKPKTRGTTPSKTTFRIIPGSNEQRPDHGHLQHRSDAQHPAGRSRVSEKGALVGLEGGGVAWWVVRPWIMRWGRGELHTQKVNRKGATTGNHTGPDGAPCGSRVAPLVRPEREWKANTNRASQ